MTVTAENQHLRDRVRLLEYRASLMRQAPSPEAAERMQRVHQRADSISSAFGERAPAVPAAGVGLDEFTRRCIRPLLKHSPEFAGEQLFGLTGPALAMVAERVFADAERAIHDAATSTPGRLVARQHRDSVGRLITTFDGDPIAWMSPFMTAGSVGRIERSAVAAGRSTITPRGNHGNS